MCASATETASDKPSIPPRRRSAARIAWCALVVVLMAGVADRVTGAWLYRYSQNPDYAVVVQMARHIAEGRDWPVFYYGQSYMGSLEPSISALLVWLFGPAPFWVCLGTALVGVGLLFAVARWAAELGGIWAAVAAAALACIGPVGYFQYMASPRGGYALGLLLTVLILRAGSSLAWHARQQRTVSVLRCAELGFLGGLAFWNFWLTLPALAAAGIVLLLALRARILRFRVWFPGALAFALGSLPFWVWNVRHGWSSFSAQEAAAGRGQVLHAVRMLFQERLPLLLDAAGMSFARAAVILVPYALLVVLVLVVLWPRRRTRWEPHSWALAAIVLNAGFFTASYALSSFSIPRTPRYLLPFVPLFAVLVGTTVVRLCSSLRGRWSTLGWGSRTRAAAVVSVALLCLGTILVNHARTLPRHRTSRGWFDTARALADELPRRGADAAIADYVLYGFNWAADERFCFSSPRLERYAPFSERLERAKNPAVIENFRGFDHFLAATSTSADYESIAGYRVHSNAQAPSTAVLAVQDHAIAAMRDGRGTDVREALTDLFVSTLTSFVPRRDVPAVLEITLVEPTTVCGVRAHIYGKDCFGSWSIEGRAAGETEFRELSPPHVATGYHWSGPRFYHGGRDLREEKRFAAVRLDAVRVRFHARGGQGVVHISEFTLLQPDGEARHPDVAAIAAVLRARGVRRVHAGRWLANELYDALRGTVWTSRCRSVYGDADGDATVVPSAGTAIAAESAALHSVRLSLRMLDIDADEVEVGGITLFLLPDHGADAAAYRGLRYSGDLLVHAHHRALAEYWLRRVESLPPGEWEETLHAALEADPAHERVQLELAALLDRSGRVAEAAAARRNARQRDRADVPITAAFFGEGLILVGLSDWPSVMHPGQHFAFEAEWRLAPSFRLPGGAGLCVHFVRDGKIVFQADEPMQFYSGAFDGSSDIYFSTHHSVFVPEAVAEGVYTPMLGVFRGGLFGRRAAVETDLPTSRNRVLVPGTFEVKR